MPKVHDEGGYQVYVYNPPREHGPAHVHVFRAAGEIVRAVRIIEENREQLLEDWRRIHG
jgi:hypothetical protein